MKNNLSKLVTCIFLALTLSAAGSTSVQPLRTIPSETRASFDAFEASWQQIETFISNHTLMASYETKMAIKAETRDGVHTWCCIGPGLGFPCVNGEIVFDSSDNASICAQMILLLAVAQRQ